MAIRTSIQFNVSDTFSKIIQRSYIMIFIDELKIFSYDLLVSWRHLKE